MVLIASGAAATAMVKALVAFCDGVEESAAFKTKEKLPLWLVVPEMIPATDTDSPGGNCPDASVQEYGEIPPVAVRVAL